MGRVSQSIPALFNGVSQQAPTSRLRSQAEAQTNFYSTIASGLAKRPPSQHIDKLRSTTNSSAKIHWIDRDNNEQYVVVIDKGNLEVYDLAGNQKTVTFPEGRSYLDCLNPQEDFVLMTVADHTFIVNKQIATEINNRQADLLEGKGQDWDDADCSNISTPTTNEQTAYHDYQNWCRHVVTDAADEGVVLDSFSTTTGKKYEVRFYLKVISGSVYAEWRQGDGAGNDNIATGLNPSSWTSYSYTMTETGGGSDALIRFRSTASAEFYVDNCEVREIDEDEWTPEAIIYVETGQPSTQYTVHISPNGTSRSWTTDTTEFPSTYDTDIIASNLKTELDNNTTAYDFNYLTDTSVFHIERTDGDPFTVRATDSQGNTLMKGFYQAASSFSELPARVNADKTRLKINADPELATGAWYVEFDEATSTWVETHGWAQNNRWIETSMPHVLVRNSNGTFTFQSIDWSERLVGDATTVPAPGFAGKTISDIFFYRDRLGVISENTVCLSKTGDYYNFFRDSATQVVDTDPIDTTASHTEAIDLQFALPYSQDLLLFSPKTQFVLSSEDYLSPNTVQLDQTTEFANSSKCRPVGAGPYLYFTVERGDFTGLKEYYVEATNLTRDAADVTAHVENYVPSGVFKLAASTNEDVIFCLSNASGERHKIYVYKFYWAGDEKLQSAWSQWVFDSSDTILSCFMIKSTMYLCTQRTDGLHLEKIDLQGDITDTGLGYDVYLDRRCSLTGSYNAGTGKTTWTLPYSDSTVDCVVLGSEFTDQEGNAITVTRPTATTIEATGDYSADAAFCGRKYESKYELSKQYLRTGQGKNESIAEGTLILQMMHLSFHKSGPFDVKVTTTVKDSSTHSYDYLNALRIGTQEAVIGSAYISTGTFDFPVMDFNYYAKIELIADTHTPVYFQSIEWEGNHVMRTQRT